jgi:molybdopterin-synthase adenylyltransferase
VNIRFKITPQLLAAIRADLVRPHSFAMERVGFISTGMAASRDGLVLLAQEYRPVADEDYVREDTVPVMMGPGAIRKAMQWALTDRVGIFHVHTHGGSGIPTFSGIDLRESARFVPSFVNVAPQRAHGAIVLSGDAARGQVWLSREGAPDWISEFVEVGARNRKWGRVGPRRNTTRLERQSFLGAMSSQLLADATIGVVGLGGGGSPIVQQLAHIGVGGYVLADPQAIEDTNTNRLVGATLADVETQMPKVQIAERLIRGLIPDARIIARAARWQELVDELRDCDVIVGAPDSYAERDQLERFARRNLIAYVDVGMDVHDCGTHGHLISGQVILSIPGYPCLRCCGFLTDRRLKQEAQQYGAAGAQPQVIWPNGVLASTAVGLIIEQITPWFAARKSFVYLEYDGNLSTLVPAPHMRLFPDRIGCPHHPADETGDPFCVLAAHGPPTASSGKLRLKA